MTIRKRLHQDGHGVYIKHDGRYDFVPTDGLNLAYWLEQGIVFVQAEGHQLDHPKLLVYADDQRQRFIGSATFSHPALCVVCRQPTNSDRLLCPCSTNPICDGCAPTAPDCAQHVTMEVGH